MKLKKDQIEHIHSLIYDYKTKHNIGFTTSEIEDIKSVIEGTYGKLDKESFKMALTGITCQMDNNDGMLIYHCDIFNAIKCGLESRELTLEEWD